MYRWVNLTLAQRKDTQHVCLSVKVYFYFGLSVVVHMCD